MGFELDAFVIGAVVKRNGDRVAALVFEADDDGTGTRNAIRFFPAMIDDAAKAIEAGINRSGGAAEMREAGAILVGESKDAPFADVSVSSNRREETAGTVGVRTGDEAVEAIVLVFDLST